MHGLSLLCAVCALTLTSAFNLVPRFAAAPARAAVCSTRYASIAMDGADVEAKKAAMAAKKEAAAKAKEEKAEKEGDAAEEESEEDKAAREAEEKKKAEEEAKKKAAAAAKAKAAAEAKAKKEAEELAEAVACFSEANLVLTKTAAANPPPATAIERSDYLKEKGIPEKAIDAAMKQCGIEKPTVMRDAWGRVVATNDVKYSPNPTPPPADAFGQMRPRD